MSLRSGKLGSADYYLVRLRPRGKHRRFRILKQIKQPDGKIVSSTVQDPRLDQINDALLASDESVRITMASADKAVQDLLQRLYAERDADKPLLMMHSDNVAIFESFWKTEYGATTIKRPELARQEFHKVLKALGNLNVLTASKDELRAAMEAEAGLRAGKTDRDAERRAKKLHSRLVGRLNQLLRGIGRDIEIPRGTVPRPAIKYITTSELQKLLAELSDPNLRTLVTAAFGTGMRCGELFAYDPEDVKRGGMVVFVEEQLKVRKVRETEGGLPRFYRDETKNRVAHDTFVLPFAREAVRAWLEVPEADRETLRVARLSELVKTAAKKLWPAIKKKHIGFHDLRHCYAVHCLSTLGYNLTTVANFLGDNYQTVQWYYSGHVTTDEGMERCEQIAQAAAKTTA